ncbi:hypothetical protein ACP70R_021958 [Stipagrostis hirtigluma subsp. patula]
MKIEAELQNNRHLLLPVSIYPAALLASVHVSYPRYMDKEPLRKDGGNNYKSKMIPIQMTKKSFSGALHLYSYFGLCSYAAIHVF